VKQQLGIVTIAAETDRVYRTIGAPVAVVDPVLRRRIRIETVGSASAVVWNPWVEKARRLGDVGEDGYRHFVCVETANAGPDQVVVAPGATHMISASISTLPI
jgi:glucose-6-phosphate 1-epimerase